MNEAVEQLVRLLWDGLGSLDPRNPLTGRAARVRCAAVTTRVIQWSTGNVGYHALRGIIGHPELELVGLWVHSPRRRA